MRRAPVRDEVRAPQCCTSQRGPPSGHSSKSESTTRAADSGYRDTWLSALTSASLSLDILRHNSLVANASSGRSISRSHGPTVGLKLYASASSSGVSSPSPKPISPLLVLHSKCADPTNVPHLPSTTGPDRVPEDLARLVRRSQGDP